MDISTQESGSKNKFSKAKQFFQSKGVIGVVLICALIIIALIGPLIAPKDPNLQDLTSRLQPPGWVDENGHTYWLGSDHLGRDILSRIIYGARVSLFVGVVAVSITSIIGTTLGIIAGYYRGIFETIIMRLVDLVLSLPFILLALAVIGISGSGLMILILIIALTQWARYTRVQYGQVLSFTEREFVQAAQALGGSNLRIII